MMRGVAEVRHLLGDLVLHRHLVLVGHDDDARTAARRVGDGQLGNDVEDRGRPVEDDGVILFEDDRATLAQLIELALETGGEHADQRRDDEDAAQGDEQHDPAETPAGVAAHGAAVEGAHQRFPHCLAEGQRARAFGGDLEDGQHGAGDEDQDQRQDGEPADQRDGPRGHGFIELVAQPCAHAASAAVALLRHDLPPPPCSPFNIQSLTGAIEKAAGVPMSRGFHVERQNARRGILAAGGTGLRSIRAMIVAVMAGSAAQRLLVRQTSPASPASCPSRRSGRRRPRRSAWRPSAPPAWTG